MITGIYQIRNLINDKIYIGSAVNIRQRWYVHITRLRYNKHHSPHLQSAWNKYGEENFEFSILEECEPIKETLLEREQYYLDILHPEYNISPTAGSPLGTKRSEETRLKMSIAQQNISAETREKLSNALTGHIVSAETREKMSRARIGHHPSAKTLEKMSKWQIGKVLSAETRDKISQAQTGRIVSAETRERMSKAQKERYGHCENN